MLGRFPRHCKYLFATGSRDTVDLALDPAEPLFNMCGTATVSQQTSLYGNPQILASCGIYLADPALAARAVGWYRPSILWHMPRRVVHASGHLNAFTAQAPADLLVFMQTDAERKTQGSQISEPSPLAALTFRS
jgi:hypothetical protein